MRFVYETLIINGRVTIDTVPSNLKNIVLEDLKIMGLDGYGKPL